MEDYFKMQASLEKTEKNALYVSFKNYTYTRALSELCRAYNLPVPDLAHVHKFNRQNPPGPGKMQEV